MPKFVTACPRNCYSTCTIQAEVENGRLRRIEPFPGNRATPEGACLKGLSYVERVHSPDRIVHPLRRLGDGTFGRITWDEALDTIADKLQHCKTEFGPQSVLYYSASGTKGLLNGVGMNFWRLFGGCTTTYGDLCWPAGLEATRLTLGDNKHNAPWDLAHAQLIILWGKNAAETNIHQMVFVERALENGAKLIVVDPRRTQTSERANLLVQPRPGTDGALALAIAHELIRAGHVDQGFVAQHVLGFAEFAASVADFTPEKAAAMTDVPADTIRRMAHDLGTISPATICAGFGMQRYTNSGQTMRAMIALLALTGNIGQAGAGWQFANLQTDIFHAERDPIAFYPPDKPDGVVRVSISTSRLGQEMLATTDPPLKMVWVERGNPITQNPETNTVLKAFRALDFRVVVEQFMTDTAREADIILPAKTFFEQTDIINAYWHPYIQWKPKVLDPPGEVKPETEVYYHLARRLGFTDDDLAGHIPEPNEAALESWLADKLAQATGYSLTQLRQGPMLPPNHEEVAFADRVFPTPSGRIELLSEEANKRWGVDPLPTFHESAESLRVSPLAKRYPLYFMTPNTKNRIHSQFNNLEMIRALSPAPFVAIHPHDANLRSIKQGSQVRIFNDRGELRLQAHVEPGLKPGCVVVTNGWWISQGGTVNFCSIGRETDLGHGAAFHDNLVDVELLSET